MKKFLLSLLVFVLVLSVLGATAYAGYRYGYTRGALAASDGNLQVFGRGFGFNPDRMPMYNFGFDRGFGRGEFGMMQRGFGFGFFRPLAFLGQLLFWGLIGLGIYLFITRSGWRLTRTTPAATTTTTTVVETPPPAPTEENRNSDLP